MVVAELNKNINGNVSIQEVNVNLFTHFPSVGVSLKNILITDSQYNKHHKALLKAEKLNVRVSAFRLFKKENPVTILKKKTPLPVYCFQMLLYMHLQIVQDIVILVLSKKQKTKIKQNMTRTMIFLKPFLFKWYSLLLITKK